MVSDIPRDEKSLLTFLDGIDAESAEVMKPRYSAWDRSIRLYNTGTPDLQPGTPMFRANLIKPLLRRQAAIPTETEPLLSIQPAREGLGTTARILRQTIRAIWKDQNVQMLLEDLEMFCKLCQSGFLSVTYDPRANYGIGDIALNVVDPRDIVVDPMIVRARDMDAAQYVRIRTVAPLDLIKRQFPWAADRIKASGKVVAHEKDAAAPRGMSRIRGAIEQAQRAWGPKGSAIPRVELKEYWVVDHSMDTEGNLLYPSGRVFIRADNTICNRHDPGGGWEAGSPNPYYDGRWPFEWLDNTPDPDSAWGSDDLEDIRRVQDAFNKLGNNVVKSMIVNAHSIIVTDQNAVDTDAVNTLRNMGFHVIVKQAQREFRRDPSPVGTQSYQAMMGQFQGLVEYVAGLQDAGGNIGTSRGRAEVRSSAMLEGLQAAGQVLVRAHARRLESFLERVGQKLISRVFQFYTTDRLMSYVGEQGQIQQYQFERQKLMAEILVLALHRYQQESKRQHEAEDERQIEEFGVSNVIKSTPQTLGQDQILAAIKGAWREFRFKVEPFSSLAANRMQRAELKQRLAQQMMLPDWMALEEAGFDNPKELLQEALQWNQMKQAMGVPPPQPDKKPTKGKK